LTLKTFMPAGYTMGRRQNAGVTPQPQPALAPAEQASVLQALLVQENWCREPSPFTSRLLAVTRHWLAAEPQALQAWAAVTADPLAAALALRWVGGLHHLALRGLEPWRGLWPPRATSISEAALFDAVDRAWSEHRAHVMRALQHPPQTNEVARSAMLLPGLLHLSAQNGGMPLALLELGSSAGLNLWPDQWHYDFGCWQWGSPDAPLKLAAVWEGAAPRGFPDALVVAERQGCDLAPIDLQDPDEALRLQSFVWPDQIDRLTRLKTAITAVAAARNPAGAPADARVHQAGAAHFVAAALQRARPQFQTVVMHSIVWQYIAVDEQARIAAALQAAGARATAAAPLAWLRMEPPAPERPVELLCTQWPATAAQGQTQVLARVHPHGQYVEWLGAMP
jgi:hypothetical protein